MRVIEGIYHFDGFPFSVNKDIYFRCGRFNDGCNVKVKYENEKYYYTNEFCHNHEPNPIHQIHEDISNDILLSLDRQIPKKKIAVTVLDKYE